MMPAGQMELRQMRQNLGGVMWARIDTNELMVPKGRLKTALKIAVLTGTIVALSGCVGLGRGTWASKRTEVNTPMGAHTMSDAARSGAAFERNPENPEAALTYARSLREMGSNQEAAFVLGRAAIKNTNHARLQAEYAKALTAAGRNEFALETFEMAHALNPGDWTLISAEGIALDQSGKHKQARERYKAALKLTPDNPDVLTNLALSHMLSGNLSASEAILRRASRQTGAGPQVRQNLALVLGLRGRFAEAERLAASDLGPIGAAQNVAMMKKMYEQPALWAQAQETAPLPHVSSQNLQHPDEMAMQAAAPPAPKPARAALRPSNDGTQKARTGKPALTPTGMTAATRPKTPAARRPAVAPPAAQGRAQHSRPRRVLANDIDDRYFTFDR